MLRRRLAAVLGTTLLIIAGAFSLASPAGAWQGRYYGPVQPGWSSYTGLDYWSKLNVFYGGGGTFHMCGALKDPYTSVNVARDCGYANYRQPQVHAYNCGRYYTIPYVYNGDNSAHTFDVRLYWYC